MFKFIGMIVGAGLILLAGIAWLDTTQAKKVSSQIHEEVDEVIDQIAEQSVSTSQSISENLPETVKEVVDQVIEQTHVAPQTVSEQLPVTETEVVEQVVSEDTLPSEEPAVEESDALNTGDGQWHIFWKPFDSSRSAEGFAQRLSQQTGVKITVISNELQQHRLTFSYVDEEDKQRILQLIQEKTGLEVQ